MNAPTRWLVATLPLILVCGGPVTSEGAGALRAADFAQVVPGKSRDTVKSSRFSHVSVYFIGVTTFIPYALPAVFDTWRSSLTEADGVQQTLTTDECKAYQAGRKENSARTSAFDAAAGVPRLLDPA